MKDKNEILENKQFLINNKSAASALESFFVKEDEQANGIDKIELKEILDVKAIQSLMDDFFSLTGAGAMAILDLHGEVLVSKGWQDICTKFHRVNKETCKNCLESDTYLSLNIKRGEFASYKCKNNMWDIATPIFVCDKHVGNLFLGQFFYDDEEIDDEMFIKQADKHGFDKDEYLTALKQVPRWSREKVKTAMDFYTKFAQIISDLLSSNVSLKKSLEENKKIINELKRSNTDLEQFAYLASHDLQEPVRMINSYSKLLIKKHSDILDENAKQYFDFINESSGRMQNLIRDLLNYSRVINSKRNIFQIDLNEIVSEVLYNLKLSIEESGANISYTGFPKIFGDRVQLSVLFQNLISNAIKYRSTNSPEIFLDVKKESGKYIFSITDNGIGIDEMFFEKIFKMFQRLHDRSEYEGTGIGLALCKRIVENHSGKIWVKSEPGKGSTFYFTLPL